MNKAIVTQDLFDERVETWLEDQNAYKIGIREDSSALDVLIVEEDKKTVEANSQKVLRKSQYNKQQSWIKSGRALKNWSETNSFHLGNPVVMATWLAGKQGASEIAFANVLPEKETDAKYEVNQFRDVMRQLRDEFGLEYFFTDGRAQLFKDIGAKEYDPLSASSNEREPIRLPSLYPIFSYGKKFAGNQVSVRSESGVVGAVVEAGGKTYTATSQVPETRSRIKGGRLILLSKEPIELKKTLGLYANEKQIYMLSDGVLAEIENLQPEPLSDVSVVSLALRMGGFKVTAEMVETSQKDFMNRIEGIRYV
jgi:hypothetical protein